MQAVILAAGNSNRFYPFTFLSHKSMLELMGKPLLLSTLESLEKSGISEAILVIGKNSPIPEKIGTNVGKLSIRYIQQKETLGMGHALLQAKEYLSDSFFLLSGYHLEFGDFYESMLSKKITKESVVLLAKEDSKLESYGVLTAEGERVTGIQEKIGKKTEKAFRIIGMYLLSQKFLETLHDTPLEHYHFEKALNEYAKSGNVTFVSADAPSFTLKYPWDILEAKDYLLTKTASYISPKASIAQNVLLQGSVYVSDGVKILEGACIKGPCYLGENAVIGNNAIIRNGVIVEKNAVIGATMEVKNSVIMEGVTTHTGFIGDSVIGPFSRLAAGFCSANVRFDRGHITSLVRGEEVNSYRTHAGVIMGEHVDTGTNVSTMPGVILGNKVTIGPSSTVMENVDDTMLLYTKFETIVKKKHE